MVIDDILEMVKDDMVSHGLLAQCVEQATSNHQTSASIEKVLEELLTCGKVEIGTAKAVRDDFVEFVAWKGSVPERVTNAMRAVAAAQCADKEFAYWLCLRENADRFDGE